jgi:hypothetical protein
VDFTTYFDESGTHAGAELWPWPGLSVIDRSVHVVTVAWSQP